MAQNIDTELLREFVSIGKHSFICPLSQQALSKRYPGLELRKNAEDCEGNGPKNETVDMVKEIVIDEFSLLLFESMDDFLLLKERENQIKEAEQAQEKQRRYEQDLKAGKIKKKGRKSKIDLKREKKEAERRARRERKEKRRLEREKRKHRKVGSADDAAVLAPHSQNSALTGLVTSSASLLSSPSSTPCSSAAPQNPQTQITTTTTNNNNNNNSINNKTQIKKHELIATKKERNNVEAKKLEREEKKRLKREKKAASLESVERQNASEKQTTLIKTNKTPTEKQELAATKREQQRRDREEKRRERERCREEKKRLKEEKKVTAKNNGLQCAVDKHQIAPNNVNKVDAAIPFGVPDSSPTTSTALELGSAFLAAVPPSTPTTNSSAQPQTILDKQNGGVGFVAKIKIEKLVDNNNNNAQQNPKSLLPFSAASSEELTEQKPHAPPTSQFAADMKRPSATIGIATVHRNGLIQSPLMSVALLSQQQSQGMGPPPSKLVKLDVDDCPLASATSTNLGYGNKGGILIGIAGTPTTSTTINSPGQQQQTQSSQKSTITSTERASSIDKPSLLQQPLRNAEASVPSGSAGQQALKSQENLQQALQKNPELAFDFHQSLATLYSIDPALMARATASLGPNFPFASNSEAIAAARVALQLQKPLGNDQRACTTTPSSTAASFPHGVPLASQLATLAAVQQNKPQSSSQSIPFKNRRWCNMHAVIAHEIAKHQAFTKNSSSAAGRPPSTATTTPTSTIGIAGRHATYSSGSSVGRRRGGAQPVERKSGLVALQNSLQQKGKVLSTNNSKVVQNQQQQASSSTAFPLPHSSATCSSSAGNSAAPQLHLQEQQQQHRLQFLHTPGGEIPALSDAQTEGAAVAASAPSSSNHSVASSVTSLQQQLNLLLAHQQQFNQQQHRQQHQQLVSEAAMNESLLTSSMLARLQQNGDIPSDNTFGLANNSLLSSATALGLLPSLGVVSQMPQQLFGGAANNNFNVGGNNSIGGAASNSLLAAAANSPLAVGGHLFGGYPVQPLGPGTGSLTSGNSDAAAAAQLQHHSHLLAPFQQQQKNVLSSSSLAASLIAQLGSVGSGLASNSCGGMGFAPGSLTSGLSALAAAAAAAPPNPAPRANNSLLQSHHQQLSRQWSNSGGNNSLNSSAGSGAGDILSALMSSAVATAGASHTSQQLSDPDQSHSQQPQRLPFQQQQQQQQQLRALVALKQQQQQQSYQRHNTLAVSSSAASTISIPPPKIGPANQHQQHQHSSLDPTSSISSNSTLPPQNNNSINNYNNNNCTNIATANALLANQLLGSNATESILAAFLSGQSMEPKVAFPPPFPTNSSASSSMSTIQLTNNNCNKNITNNNSNSSNLLNTEQQRLLRLTSADNGELNLGKLHGAPANGSIAPTPSSLIACSLGGTTPPMNPVEQELLMRQIRIAQEQINNGFRGSTVGGGGGLLLGGGGGEGGAGDVQFLGVGGLPPKIVGGGDLMGAATHHQ